MLNQSTTTRHTTSRITPARLTILISGLEAAKFSRPILQLLDDFHYANGSQIQRLFFVSGTPLAATRARNRALTSLVSMRLLYRYPRQPLSGNLHGSTEYIYALAHAGQRVMNELRKNQRPKRSINRTTEHIQHALAVTELHVCMVEAERAGQIELIKSRGEPACHKHFGMRKVLKPDGFVDFKAARNGQLHEVAWFIEVERSREGETSTIAKLSNYREYMEQLDPDTQFMPRVLFVTYTEKHRAHLERLLDRNTGTDRDVFMVVLADQAIPTMITGEY